MYFNYSYTQLAIATVQCHLWHAYIYMLIVYSYVATHSYASTVVAELIKFRYISGWLYNNIIL